MSAKALPSSFPIWAQVIDAFMAWQQEQRRAPHHGMTVLPHVQF